MTIVVGVSPRSGSPGALRWAVEEAAARGGRVVAVRAWRPHTPHTAAGGRVPSVMGDDAAELDSADRQLTADVRAVLGDGSAVESRVVVGKRRNVLVDASRGADLLVIDAGHSSEVGTRWIGSRLARRARCPVVVVPPSLAERGASGLTTAAKAVGRSVAQAAGTAGRPGFRRPPATPYGDPDEP